MSEHRQLKTWLSWIAALGVVAAVVPLLWAWPHLPDPLATHFGASGSANGNMSRAALLAFQAGQVLLIAFLAWPHRRGLSLAAVVAPARVSLLGYLSATATAMGLVTIWLNWDRAVWQDAAPFNPLLLVAMLGVPALVAGALFLLARRSWPRQRDARATRPDVLPLADGEPAYWSGAASNGWFLGLALFIVIEGGVVQLIVMKIPVASRLVFALHVLLVLVLELCSKIRVTVDEQALTVRYGRLGWLRQRVALERILAATAFELDPWAHGGWGYRGNLKLLGKAAIVVRAGRALRLDLRDGKRLSVTVDDAETAARLVNGFVQRRGPAPSPGLAGATPSVAKLAPDSAN
jgi:hypothetical protein